MKHGGSKIKINKVLKKNTKFMKQWDNNPQKGGSKNNISLIKRIMNCTAQELEIC